MKIPIFVALDVDNENQALELARQVSSNVGGFKVGPRLLMRYGSSLVKKLSELGDVFVDNKYHDIPSTVQSAVKASFESGASFVTVHASNGYECLTQLAELEEKLNQERPFKILVVTVLTSFDENNKPINWQDLPLENQVLSLAGEAFRAGLTGIVCSGYEVKKLKELYPKGFFVTPGIRLASDAKDDQKRILTPEVAIRNGATALVVGRPIILAQDPKVAAFQFAQSIKI
ncbi:MAG: orotidine-5'-phosphate decarboxylase [Bdellovibrionaceae bacterium]|nr:orotidine-5'-phosphate decarboxylase [Pseudobdellovibrionaceae bacterium]